MTDLEWSVLATRLAVSLVCGAIMGWDREWRGKPAGLRTHMLVTLGACAFTLLSLELLDFGSTEEQTQLDPLRTVQGIIGGIGFLGGGAIIQARGSVRGMTTAANIWVNGAIGVACGAGLYPLAILTTLAAFFVLVPLGMLEQLWRRNDGQQASPSGNDRLDES